MLLQIALFGLGLVLLLWGADVLVKGASSLALRLGVSPLVIGVVLVGFGTSAPELTVSLTALVGDHFDIAVGNVIGSNIANIGLVLGATALVAPLTVKMRLLRIETPMLMIVARDARAEPASVQEEFSEALEAPASLPVSATKVLLGLLLMVYASRIMVGSAVNLAQMLGVSELVIGLTVVAIGTSLPELAASLVAAWRREVDIAVGNVLGSCLFNLLLIIGVSAAVHPLQVNPGLKGFELPLMLAFTFALYPLMRRRLRLGRREGGLLMIAFAAFLGAEVWLAA